MYRNIFKRFLDIIFSGITIILFLPLMVIVALIIYLQDRHTPIFVQKRVGLQVKEFSMFKFRSMPINVANVESHDINKIRVTNFGKIIRRLNIDELPQLFNIFIGDMSIVGPRPCILPQKELINLRLKGNTYNCKPGLTGLSQVNSYDNMPNSEKAKFDNIYASDVSLAMDIKIILKTFIYLTKKPPTY